MSMPRVRRQRHNNLSKGKMESLSAATTPETSGRTEFSDTSDLSFSEKESWVDPKSTAANEALAKDPRKYYEAALSGAAEWPGVARFRNTIASLEARYGCSQEGFERATTAIARGSS